MGRRWIKLDKVASTNSYASTLLNGGRVKEEVIVVADYQGSGRGQGDRLWHSEPGKNLLMSLLLFPAFLSASRQFQLSRVASLAICDALDSMDMEPVIKWPNDILTSKGKIAGILIEHGIIGKNISHTIVGIGMNVNQIDFPNFPVPATSVFLEKGITPSLQMVAEIVVSRIMSRYEALRNGRGKGLEQEFLDKLYLRNQPAQFKTSEEKFQGIIRGVTDMGELQVERDGRLFTFNHGEIDCLAI